MNQRQLESFLAIAKHGSFAAAAERLYLTQSTISARIKELEDDLGVELFDRSQKKVQLTAKGRSLVEYAEQVDTLFSEIRSKVGDKSSVSGVVRIGLVEIVAVTWMSNLVALLKQEYPALNVEFEVGLTPSLFDRLRARNLDIAIIIGALSIKSKHSLGLGFASRRIGALPFAWMAADQLDVPPGILLPRDLRKYPIIYAGTESFMNNFMNEWLLQPISRKLHGTSCTGLDSIMSLVAANIGISLLPVALYASQVESRKLKILQTEPAKVNIPFSVLYSQHGNSSVIERISELCVIASSFDKSLDDD